MLIIAIALVCLAHFIRTLRWELFVKTYEKPNTKNLLQSLSYRTHALDGVDCTCGAKGCWERYAATTALVRAAQEENPAWKDGRAIFAAAEAGDKTVLALLDAWTDEIAQGLAGMVHIFNPQLILIGGGVSAQQKLLIDPIAAKVKAAVMPAFAEGLEIRAAQLHNDAGMVGAVYYFRQTMEKE